MGDRHHLCILIWKHLKERRHRLRHTIWEITCGVLVFVVLLLMRKVVKELTAWKDDFHGLSEVVYTPNTVRTQELMSKAISRLSRGTQRDAADEVHLKNVIGFDTETEMQDYLRHANFSVAKIVFKNFSSASTTLDYSIGIENTHPQYENGSSKLKRIHLLGEQLVPQETVHPALATLQWEIDKAFIESLAGNITHSLRTPGDQSITPMNIMHQLLVLCTVAAPLPFFLYNSSRLADEKRSGMKELMKIENVSPNILRLSHLVDTAMMAIIYATLITILLKVTSTPILPHSCAGIIAVTIVLYFMCVTSLAFVTSTLSDNYEHANSLALVIYIATCALSHIWHTHAKNTSQVLVACWFLPHAAIYMFWDEVHYLEKIGQGTRFGNLFDQHDSTCIPVPLAWTILLWQFLFIMMLTWYLDLVIPGVYGVTLPWYFVFQKRYWCHKQKKVNFHVTSERSNKLLRDDRYYEHISVNIPIVTKLSEVTKTFTSSRSYTKALDNVSFDAYGGEITVILGTNGAGKTTIASIIAGMTSATTGKIYVNGYDNSIRIQEVRQFIGLCPQQHLTFDYLTVRENIMFFEKLGRKQEAGSRVEGLMARLHLLDKADHFSHQLSSGGERCLQMACTLAGGADVLILDEPTANCDATTRHYLWDAILVLRGYKTILMTTTSIEEADALGDRIALLSHGRLRCYGTPTFLKNAIGTVFNLTVTTTDDSNLLLIRDAVLLHLPDVTSNIEPGRVIFTLPAKDHQLFPALFTTLEERREELGIAGMDMGMSIEDMFLGFVEDTADDDEALFVKMFHDVEKLRGWRLHAQQLGALMKKNFRRLWSNKYQFVILQLAVPVLGLIVVTIASNTYVDRDGHTAHTVLLGLYGDYRRSGDMEYVKRAFPGLKILRSQNITIDYAKVPHKQHEHVIAIQMDTSQSDLYHPMHSQQDLTKAVNLFSNMFLTLNWYPRHHIRTDYITRTAELELVKPKEPIVVFLWAMWVTFIITVPLTPYIGTLKRERSTGIMMTYFVVGCSYMMQWLAKLLFHSIVFLFIIPPALLLSAKFGDLESTLDQNDFLLALLVVQLCFLPAFLLQLYVLSFFLNDRHATSQIYIMSMGLGFSAPFIHLLLDALVSEDVGMSILISALGVLGNLSPVFTLSETITKLVHIASYKAFCRFNKHHCGTITADDKKYKTLFNLCCKPDRFVYNYHDAIITIPTFGVFLAQVLLYSIILISLQNKCLQSICDKIFNFKYQAPIIHDQDHNVNLERICVDQLMSHQMPPRGMLLVKDLHKKYLSIRKANRINAVKGVTFKVERGECLALLGRNGAGKTSTLRMIAGHIPATRGECCADGLCLSKSRLKYIEKIAKIKDKRSLNEFYTGAENVALLCLLRGYRRGHAEMFAVNWMAYMGLQRYTHTLYGAVSPGCARRIGLCAALLAGRFAVLVDEPMRSVDPHARPLVKRALTKLRSKGCALLVAEKSLDWLELDSLASRIAVLSNGQIIALGSSHHIRNLLANGHTARLKLKLKPMQGLVKEGTSVINTNDDLDKQGPSDSDLESRNRRVLGQREPAGTSQGPPDSGLEGQSRRDLVGQNEPASTSQSPSNSDPESQNRRDLEGQSEPASTSRGPSDSDTERLNRRELGQSDPAGTSQGPPDSDLEGQSRRELGGQSQPARTSQSPSNSDSESQNRRDSESQSEPASTSQGPPDSDLQTQNRRELEPQSGPAGTSQSPSNSDPERQNRQELSQNEPASTSRGPSDSDPQRQTRRELGGQSEPASTSHGQSDRNLGRRNRRKSFYNLTEARRFHEAQEVIERDRSTPDASSRVSTEESAGYGQRELKIAESEVGLAQGIEKKEFTSFNIISLNEVQDLKNDFKRQFPTSELAEEHLSVLYFHIRGDNAVPYSEMFSRLEWLKLVYHDIVEDFSLSQISLEDMYSRLDKI